MNSVQGSADFHVSKRGQFSLPASARRRWDLLEGGQVEVFDLGDAVVVLPCGKGSARSSLAEALTAERYNELVCQIEDPDLVDQ